MRWLWFVSLQLTLSQPQYLALVGDTMYRGEAGFTHFHPTNTTVTIGGVPAPIVWNASWVTTASGQRRRLDAASVLDTSGSGGADVIFVQTPAYSMVCATPSACDGDSSYKAIVVQNPPVMKRRPRIVAGGTVSCPPLCPGFVQSPMGRSGAYYTSSCVGFASGAVCLSAATADQCGFGPPGFNCTQCPSGCLCPGGPRCW